MSRKKSLVEHQRDIENIVKTKGGKVIDKEWRQVGQKIRPYFEIECDKGHKFWVRKYHLMPSKNNPEGSWCPHFECKSRTLTEHQRDIEDIVRKKGGKIIDKEWRLYGQKRKFNAPFFEIECDKGHKFWVRKHSLKPSKNNPEGSWCTHPDCRGKSLVEHQRDIEDIVREKGGKIIDKEWRLYGQKRKFNAPFFEIECDKGHKFWVRKNYLMPSKNNPEGSWCPICQDRISAIGTCGHVPIEYFSLIHLNSKGCKVEHEKTLEEGTRPDLIVDRDDNFKKNIEKHQNVVLFSNNIEEIAVDFTFGLTGENILAKCFKSYQAKNRFLLIVLLRERGILTVQHFQNLINNDVNIDNEEKKRIKVINFEAYLDFLNLGRWNFRKTEEEKKIESKLRRIIILCKKSIDSDSALATLARESKKYAQLLGVSFAKQKFAKLDSFFNQFT